MITYCAWCPKDAPPMHDDGRSTLITHGICQAHLFEMRAKLEEVPSVDDVRPDHDRVEEANRD